MPTVSGQVLAIGFNKPGDIRPTQVTVAQWMYSLFDYYGGGVFNPDYSPGGAWTVAGSGGHGVPAANIGGCVFDFEDATWKLHLAAHTGAVPRGTDFAFSECTFGMINGTSPPCPAPAHQYRKISHAAPGQMGAGAKGAFLRLRGDAATTTGGQGTDARIFDWVTNLWTDAASNSLADFNGQSTRNSHYDVLRQRWIVVPHQINNPNAIHYLSLAGVWSADPITGMASGSASLNGFYDSVRDVIVVINPTTQLAWGANLASTGSWQPLTLANANLLEAGNETDWAFYPPDGCFYNNKGEFANSHLLKITPPPIGQAFTGTWTVSHSPLSSALPVVNPDAFPPAPSGNAQHYNRLFYVPSLQLLCWIPGFPRNTTSDQVFLIKP